MTDHERIRACMMECHDPHAMDDDARIRACLQDDVDPDAMDHNERIARAAGLYVEPDLTKALLDEAVALLAELRRPRPPAPRYRPRPPSPPPARPAPPTPATRPARTMSSRAGETTFGSSSDGLLYYDMRDGLAADIRRGLVKPNLSQLFERVVACTRLGPAESAEVVEKFLRDTQRHRARAAATSAETKTAP